MLGEKRKIDIYLIALLFVIAGAVFIFYPDIGMTFVCRFFASVFTIAGIVMIISYFFTDVMVAYGRLHFALGIMSLFAALLFLVRQEAVDEYFPVIAGSLLFANGVIKLQHSIDMKRIDRKLKKVMEMWLVIMIFAILCILSGIITVFLTPDNDRTLFIILGVSLIFAGITDVFARIVFDRKVKELKESGEEGVKPEEAPVEEPQTLVENVEKEEYTEPALAETAEGSEETGTALEVNDEAIGTDEAEDAADPNP